MSTATMKNILALALVALVITIQWADTGGDLSKWNPMETLSSGTAIVLVGLFIYLLPAVIANQRRAQNSGLIFLLNLLMGFTIIGWVAAFIWAAVDRPRAS